jgi:hypothetical protein
LQAQKLSTAQSAEVPSIVGEERPHEWSRRARATFLLGATSLSWALIGLATYVFWR